MTLDEIITNLKSDDPVKVYKTIAYETDRLDNIQVDHNSKYAVIDLYKMAIVKYIETLEYTAKISDEVIDAIKRTYIPNSIENKE